MPSIAVVDAEVRLEVAHDGEGAAAFRALERLLSRMTSNVHLEVGSIAELLRAILAHETPTSVRVLASNVASECARMSELLLTMHTSQTGRIGGPGNNSCVGCLHVRVQLCG